MMGDTSRNALIFLAQSMQPKEQVAHAMKTIPVVTIVSPNPTKGDTSPPNPKTLAIIGAINGVAPVAAPIIGGGLTEGIDRKGIFWVLLALGIILLLGCRLIRQIPPTGKQHACQ